MMAEEQKMNFYRSLYDLASLLSEKGRKAVLVAMLDYFFEGIEPDRLTANERKAFEAVRGRIEASRRNGSNRRGGAGNETRDETADERRHETRNETSNETADEKGFETYALDGDSQRPPSLSPSLSTEGVQGEGPESPTLDEVREYFAANCLRGDPQLFWATYEATGWVDGNGRPIVSWTAQALRWSRRQVNIDAERAARGEPPAGAAEWRPAPREETEEDLAAAEAAYRRKWGERA